MKDTPKDKPNYKSVSIMINDYNLFEVTRKLLEKQSPVSVSMPQMLVAAVTEYKTKLEAL